MGQVCPIFFLTKKKDRSPVVKRPCCHDKTPSLGRLDGCLAIGVDDIESFPSLITILQWTTGGINRALRTDLLSFMDDDNADDNEEEVATTEAEEKAEEALMIGTLLSNSVPDC